MSAIARIGYASYLNHTTLQRGVSDLHHDQIMEKDIPYSTFSIGQVAKIMRELKNLRCKAVIGQTVLVLRLYSYMQRLAMARGGI